MQELLAFTFPGNPGIWPLSQQIGNRYSMNRCLHTTKSNPHLPHTPGPSAQLVSYCASWLPSEQEHWMILPDTHSAHFWHRETSVPSRGHYHPLLFTILVPS